MLDAQPILDALARITTGPGSAPEKRRAFVRQLQRARPLYTGIYLYVLRGEALVLGEYVGRPTEHTSIPVGAGICGASARSGRTLVVDDVLSDERYIACSVETRSEIVVPVKRGGRYLAQIDIDSDRPAAFGPKDRWLLERAAALLAPLY
ncbi:GAF domain-containing protein [Vulgatibacter sp.]|uniref:GAF domain-containing protein n=1 Tax=Vulgatibacter sp. TaxID=1971226 RepID=UPI003563BE25